MLPQFGSIRSRVSTEFPTLSLFSLDDMAFAKWLLDIRVNLTAAEKNNR